MLSKYMLKLSKISKSRSIKTDRSKFQNLYETKYIKKVSIAVCSALGLLGLNMTANANQFADIPLHLQSRAERVLGYSVKSNVTFYIDDSGSMNQTVKGDDRKVRVCKQQTIPCLSLNTNKKCAQWDTASNNDWTLYYVKHNAESGEEITDDPSKPLEEHLIQRFDYCFITKNSKLWNVKNTMATLVSKYQKDFYFSFQPLNNNHLIFNKFFDTEDSAQNNELVNNLIYKMTSDGGGTHITRRLYSVARNTVMNKLKYRCQKSYLIILTDGRSRNSLPLADSKDLGYDGYFDGDTERHSRELKKDFVHLLEYYTKTLGTKSFGDYIYDTDIAAPDGRHLISSHSGFNKRTTDDAGEDWKATDPIATEKNGEDTPFTQTAKTFTIGVGLRDDIAKQYLFYGASPRPESTDKNPLRYFYNVSDEDGIFEAFDTIFKEMKKDSSLTIHENIITNPSMGESNTSLNNLLVKAKVETGNWSSTLCFHNLNETTEEMETCNKQPSFNNRKLVLNDGKLSYLYSNTLSGLDNATFKIPDNNNKNQKEWLNGLLNWYSRSTPDANIGNPDFVLEYRERKDPKTNTEERNIGDIINNSIVAIGDTEHGKQKYLITSANDGMVYVFRATNNDTNPYDLKLNYMPMAIERNSFDGSDLVRHYYKDLTSYSYGKDGNHPHRYLLNGGFTVVRTPKISGKPRQIFMVSNMGQAGRGAFAMNIGGQDLTNSNVIAADNMSNSDWYKQLFLFQTPTGVDNEFGYTVGSPKIAITRVNRDPLAATDTYTDHLREVAFINNGFNFPGQASHQNESALYIYDVLGVDVGSNSYQRTGDAKGHLIKKLTASDGKGGLATPMIFDINDDGVADLVYAGDYGGNLYRFDIRDPNPNNWKVKKIFKAEGPITASPALFEPAKDTQDRRNKHKVVVVFGTGSDLYQTDLENKDQQAIYGIYDDFDDDAMPVITKDQLVQQEMDYSADGMEGTLSDKTLSPSKDKGWYFKLNKDGERVVSAMDQIQSTGMVVTRSYNLRKLQNGKDVSNPLADPCVIRTITETSSILSRITQFDARTGGKINSNSPRFILKGEKTHKSSYGVNGVLGFRFTNNNRYNPLRAGDSGDQKEPGSPPGENCYRLPPGMVTSQPIDGSLVGVRMCATTFKRLAWRMIKTGYFN